MTHHYALYGLTLASDLDLPDLFPMPEGGQADVSIVQAAVQSPERHGFVDSSDGSLRFEIDGVGRFEARGGTELRVDPASGSSSKQVRLYLLGSGMAAILAQRGRFALHASALAFGKKAVGFMGPSGAGKSTLAAWMVGHGAQLLSDDVCAIAIEENGTPMVFPGLARLRLFGDSLAATGLECAATGEVSFGADWRKFIVPATAAPAAAPLTALYLLDPDADGIDPVTGAAAVEALHANCYRGEYLPLVGSPRRHFDELMAIAAKVPLFRYGRSRELDDIGAANRSLLDHVRDRLER